MNTKVVSFRACFGCQPRKIGKAGEFCKARQGVFIDRQALRLLIGHHLETMFDGAQKAIGGFQFTIGILADPAILFQRTQHIERAAATQVTTVTANDYYGKYYQDIQTRVPAIKAAADAVLLLGQKYIQKPGSSSGGATGCVHAVPDTAEAGPAGMVSPGSGSPELSRQTTTNTAQ